MILTYAGHDLAAFAAKYGDAISPRVVEGVNGFDTIAGSHEPDPLAHKTDLIVNCRPLTDAQIVTLNSLAEASVATPYMALQYVSGTITLSGQYRISVSPANNIMYTAQRKLYGGVILTFTQR